MGYKYALKEKNENMAFALGRNLSISTKKATEICKKLRGKNLDRAKNILENVIAKKEAIPMSRYNDDTAHKPGIGPGKYPVKAAKNILTVLKNAEDNAQNKGLNTHHLVVHHICAHRASRPMHYGRRRRKTKRSHVEVVLLEHKKKEEKK